METRTIKTEEEIDKIEELRKEAFLMKELSPYYKNELMNRKEFFFIFKYIKLWFKSRKIYKKENPDIIISTGALISYPLLKIMHKHHKKVIYIESYARVYDLSLTAKKAYKFADLFIVQHPELKDKYPKAIYEGNLFGEII